MPFRSLLLAIAIAPSVLAASNACKGSSTVTIANQSDADALASCDTLDGSITFSPSARGVITIRNLEQVKGSFTAESAAELTSIVAPSLESVKGSLTVDDLGSLSGLSMAALARVSSGVTISSNPKLTSLSFGQLEEVDGPLLLTGSFTSVSLPSLDQVRGKTTIRGSRSMSCTALDRLQSDGAINGDYSCSPGGSAGSLSAGAKAGIAIGVIVAVMLVLFLVWYVLRRRRVRKYRRPGPAAVSPVAPVSPPLSPGVPAAARDEKPPSPKYQPVPTDDSLASVPRKPVGPPPAQLDGRSIYEAPIAATPVREYHELDAGPVVSMHQRPIHPGT